MRVEDTQDYPAFMVIYNAWAVRWRELFRSGSACPNSDPETVVKRLAAQRLLRDVLREAMPPFSVDIETKDDSRELIVVSVSGVRVAHLSLNTPMQDGPSLYLGDRLKARHDPWHAASSTTPMDAPDRILQIVRENKVVFQAEADAMQRLANALDI